MTNPKSSPTMAEAIAEVPLTHSEQYGPPPEGALPDDLRPLRAAVLKARELYLKCEADRRNAEHVNRTAAVDRKAAQAKAALTGQDPGTVPDLRGQKAAAVVEARDRETAAKTAVGYRWTELVRALCARREELLEPLDVELAEAQAEALAALEKFKAARRRLDQGLGLRGWLQGLRPHGLIDGLSTLQGPRAIPVRGGQVMWQEQRTGKVHSLDAEKVMDAVSIYARGLDARRASDELEANRAARTAGDRTVQRQPIPSGTLTVRA